MPTPVNTSFSRRSSVKPLRPPVRTLHRRPTFQTLYVCKDRFGLEMHSVQRRGDRKQTFSKWATRGLRGSRHTDSEGVTERF